MTDLKLHFKTELCDGECHMTAHDYCEHKQRERDSEQRRALTKLEHNPALSPESRAVIHQALVDNMQKNYWRNAFLHLKETYEKEIEKK